MSRLLPPLPGVDPATAPSPDDPEYSDWMERVCFTAEGIDRTQIWESLHATPTQRMRRLQEMMDFAFSVKPRETGIR